MSLDGATLFLVLIGFCLISGVALGLRWRNHPADIHLAYWSGAFLLATFSVTGLATRNFTPAWLSILVSNSVTLVAFGVAWNGIRVFGGRRPVWSVVAIAPAIWLIACAVPQVYASQPYRTFLASLLITGLCLLLAVEVLRRDEEQLPARKPFAVLCLIHAAATLLRALGALWFGHQGALALDPFFISLGLLEPIFILFGVMIVGLGLTQQRRELALVRKAAVDDLTGLLNRGAFIEAAKALLDASRGNGRNVALLVFDIDFFKDINDTFGHAVGDRTLCAFADSTRQVLRSTDIVGRIGGEEFAVLLVGADPEAGIVIAERIRAEFARRTALLDGRPVAATVSAGVAPSPGGRTALEALMVRADEALYAAKRGGRDLVHQAAE